MTPSDSSNPWTTEVDADSSVSQDRSENDSLKSEDEDVDFTYPGDYSTHMVELFDGEEHASGEEDPEDEVFIYDGVDADTSASYKDQLRDVLDQDHDETGSENEVLEVEHSLVYDRDEIQGDDTNYEDISSQSPSHTVTRRMTPDSVLSSRDSGLSYARLAKPFLHPSISRLRSCTPQSTGIISNDSSVTSHSHIFAGVSPSPSRFSSLSRASSITNLQSSVKQADQQSNPPREQNIFKWTDLQGITQTLFSRASQKVSNVLGAPLLGVPTVIAANGLICVGTTEGKVAVYDFKQTLICVCENTTIGKDVGAVTALSLSHDHTFVASGHATGHIQLYNFNQPHNPVRVVPPTTVSAVSSGRKEGHLQGSMIVSIGFVAGRHTALVSADEFGLAFYHSLGKILFVEAPDILRILGRYPESLYPPRLQARAPNSGSTGNPPAPRRTRYTTLSMAPLPLGTAPHSTDAYNVVALLTPTKLVVVGLKPTPRTWFKCRRDVDEGGLSRSKSKWTGSLAWFPSVLKASSDGGDQDNESQTLPILAYSWGNTLHLLTVTETQTKKTVTNTKTGRSDEVTIGAISHTQFAKWTAKEDLLAIQWLNHHQVIVTSRSQLGVYDIDLRRLIEEIPFDGLSLISTVPLSTEGDKPDLVSHSLRIYKGKLFVLKKDKLVAGTLLTWADRILSLVEMGDFLKAIELTRSYYLDEAPGNRNNLPQNPVSRKQVIGDKLRSLMNASAQYTFSEDRMSDGTHSTPDNRGVDRTSLFENLVKVCAHAAIALQDFEFLFEDLFQRYDDSGISSIYLRQLEPFILNAQITYVPPRITQRLIALHSEDGRPEYVERIIWHMDPSCLDLNQAIHLCHQHHLYDALIYIYTRALRDYVAPVVELLGLIRKVKSFRKSRADFLHKTGSVLDADLPMESTIMNAYKIYPYLANILSGLTYPSEEPLNEEDALQAKKDVYTFLFFGRSSVWPPGEGGKLILTSDEEGGVELTYPYARQLLLFDSESFLHSLDIAFEDGYLNESQSITRFMIVRIILEIASSSRMTQEDITMVNIFVARNVPKYTQSLEFVPPTTLHNILIGLAEDPDRTTREDRQLAAEYLLSFYNPHDSEQIVYLFEAAGFFRILRSWYYRDHTWSKLLSTYIVDSDMTSLQLMHKLEEVLTLASRPNKGVIPDELVTIVSESLARLLHVNTAGTALLVDKMVPKLHDAAIGTFEDNEAADSKRYEYLSALLSPPSSEDEHRISNPSSPSKHLSSSLKHMFLSLVCKFDPENVISTLQYISKDSLPPKEILEIYESHKIYDAAVWATNWLGDPQGALAKADTFQKRLSKQLLVQIAAQHDSYSFVSELESLRKLSAVGREICLAHSQGSSPSDMPLEDMWFKLLNSQIQTVQAIATSSPVHAGDITSPYTTEIANLLSSLRLLVQTTFGALVSITSTSIVSFPRLFKRLVNSTPSSTGSHYTEFRTILTGMLESYRSDEDLLLILKHLVDRDLFEAVEQITQEHGHGWGPTRRICQYCRKPVLTTTEKGKFSHPIVIGRSGIVFHQNCKPTVDISSQ